MIYYKIGDYMEKIELKVKTRNSVKDFLLNYGFTAQQTNKILKNRDVKRDGKRLQTADILNPGEDIVIYCENKPTPKYEIIFEDENVVVLSKGAKIEVQGEDSLEKLIDGSIAVHRLDRNTTGVMIMAKNKKAEECLKEAFKNGWIEKRYVCEVFGRPDFKGEKKEAFLLKDSARSEVKIFNTYVQRAVKIETSFKTLKKGAETSIVEVELHTGKTHQIRAHLAFLGYPIVGDGKYGNNKINKKFKENYQKLHCFSLKIKKINKNLEYLQNKEFVKKPTWAEKYL